MPQVGPLEILVILIVALLVFGPTKLPEMARQLGRGLRELRRLQEGLRRDLDEVLADDEAPTPTPTSAPKPRQLDSSSRPDSEPDPPAQPTS